MLRSLNQKGPNGEGILGSSRWGVLASEMPTGFPLPGLLNNDVLSGDATGARYRLRILSQPAAGVLAVAENGAFSFTGAPDGSYTASQSVDKYDPAADTTSSDTGAVALQIGAATTQVSSDLVILYGINAYVSSDLAIAWQVLGTPGQTSVSSDLAMTWQVFSGNSNPDYSPSRVRTIKAKAGGGFIMEGPFWSTGAGGYPTGRVDPDSEVDITMDWADVLQDISDEIAFGSIDVQGANATNGFTDGSRSTVFIDDPQPTGVTIRFRFESTSVPPRVEDRTVKLTVAEQ